ncbi:EboA domain-containing protein [Myxococcaceae bacterium GXIMD 01537]
MTVPAELLEELCARRGCPARAVRGRNAVLAEFPAAGRRAGRRPLQLDADEGARLAEAGVDWPLAPRTDDLWRITLLAAAAYAPDFEALVGDCYRGGDNEERRAVLRALPLLPEPERFVPLAVDACRTHVVPIFEAIACENPFPSRHFPDLAFRQLVLKAVFLEVRLPRVRGLAPRVDAELERMARDCADERRSAGRPVPEDLTLLSRRRDAP